MNRSSRHELLWSLFALVVVGCAGSKESTKDVSETTSAAPSVGSQLFTLMPSGYTGIKFANRVDGTQDLNVFTYRNFYNGGGVAVEITGRDATTVVKVAV